MFAGGEIHEVEIDGLRGRSGTPTGARIVGGRHAVPEVAGGGVVGAEGTAVAAPRGVSEARLSVDEDDVLFRYEFVAVVPAAVTRTDVAQSQRTEPFGNSEGHGKRVGFEEFAVVLARHFHHITGVEERQRPVLFVDVARPFVAFGVSLEVKGNLVAAGIVVADKRSDIDIALQVLP